MTLCKKWSYLVFAPDPSILLGINRSGSFPLFSAPTFSLASEQTLKDLKHPRGTTEDGGEWIWLTRPYRYHWNSPRGLNISSIRIFNQIIIGDRHFYMLLWKFLLWSNTEIFWAQMLNYQARFFQATVLSVIVSFLSEPMEWIYRVPLNYNKRNSYNFSTNTNL